MMEAGYIAQARIEEIRTEQVQMETQAQERTAMYAHDIEIGKGASQWIINLRASVRPVVTYLFVLLLIVVDIASIWWAWSSGAAFAEAIPMVFDADEMQTQAQERASLYAHDIEIGKGASQWVTNSRAMVRPAITYGMFIMFMFVELFGFWFAFHREVPFDVALNLLWDDETQIIWASIVSFWFGTQAFKK